MAKLRTNRDEPVRQSVAKDIAHPRVASLLMVCAGKIEAAIDPKATIADILGLR